MQWNPAIWWTQSRDFFREVRTEFYKVTWPTRKETTAGTIGVLVIVGVITAVLSILDFCFSWAMQRFLS